MKFEILGISCSLTLINPFLHTFVAIAITLLPQGTPPPMEMTAIAQCESGGEQFYPDGSVVENTLTHDYGAYQIHETWLPVAENMGLDVIHSEKDNIEFALWLHNKYGDSPWTASKNCWGTIDS